jgi:hypothetical protein
MEAYSLFIKAQKELPDFFKLEPEVIQEALKISAFDCEKLFACQTIFHNHLAFTSHNIFEKVCSVLNNEPSDFMNTQEFTPAEATWTVMVMRMLDPVSLFSEEVLSYIAFAFFKDGFMSLPSAILKETSEQNLPASWFLDNFIKNKDLTEEAKKIQVDMLQSVQEYCYLKVSKLTEELLIFMSPEEIRNFTLKFNSISHPTAIKQGESEDVF